MDRDFNSVNIVYAILYKHMGNVEKASGLLIESLEYAPDEMILMSFIYYHAFIKDLLTDVFKNRHEYRNKYPQKGN